MPVLKPRPIGQLEVGNDVVRIPAGHPEASIHQVLTSGRMWIEVADERMTAPLSREVVVTLSRRRDLALVRVSTAFAMYLRPTHITVTILNDRLIVQADGMTFPLMLHRHHYLRPPTIYPQDRIDYILGWIAAWEFESLCSSMVVAAAT